MLNVYAINSVSISLAIILFNFVNEAFSYHLTINYSFESSLAS